MGEEPAEFPISAHDYHSMLVGIHEILIEQHKPNLLHQVVLENPECRVAGSAAIYIFVECM